MLHACAVSPLIGCFSIDVLRSGPSWVLLPEHCSLPPAFMFPFAWHRRRPWRGLGVCRGSSCTARSSLWNLSQQLKETSKCFPNKNPSVNPREKRYNFPCKCNMNVLFETAGSSGNEWLPQGQSLTVSTCYLHVWVGAGTGLVMEQNNFSTSSVHEYLNGEGVTWRVPPWLCFTSPAVVLF